MSKEREKEKQNDASGKAMKRNLGTAAVFSICTGAMFSSGFFLLPGLVADSTGPSLPLVFIIASFFMLPAIFSIGELSSAMPRAGGPYFFLNRSFGAFIGIIGAFGKFLQLLLKGAFAFIGVGAYLSLMFDVSIEVVAIFLIIVFTGINLLGIRQTAKTEIVLVVILLLLLTYFTASGIVEIIRDEVGLLQRFQPLFPFGFDGLANAIALVFVSYAGIGQVASISEEVKKPSRSIPKGMFIALGVATLFYFLGTGLMVSLLSPNALQGDQTPVATASNQLSQLPLPIYIIVIAALAAFASTGNAAILSAARYPFALSRDHLIWSQFGKLDNKGVPKNAVIFTGAVLILLVIGLDVKSIVKNGSAFLLFVFLGMCLAVIIFRESKTDEYQPKYKTPFYPWMQIFGSIIYFWLIIESGIEAVLFILFICIIGALWYWFGVKEKTQLSGAIFKLFARMGQENIQSQARTAISNIVDPHLVEVVERAMIIDIDKEINFNDAAKESANALYQRIGGDRKEIANHLHTEGKKWTSPIKSDIAVSPVLLHGIEQPEMVILRGKINFDDKKYHGLIVLVDDNESSTRLFRLLSQLKEAIDHSDFLDVWKNAKDPNELRGALKHGTQVITIPVQEKGFVSTLKEKRLKDVNLPENSLIVLIEREGQDIIPNGDTKIKKGDKITFITKGEASEEIKNFSEKKS